MTVFHLFLKPKYLYTLEVSYILKFPVKNVHVISKINTPETQPSLLYIIYKAERTVYYLVAVTYIYVQSTNNEQRHYSKNIQNVQFYTQHVHEQNTKQAMIKLIQGCQPVIIMFETHKH